MPIRKRRRVSTDIGSDDGQRKVDGVLASKLLIKEYRNRITKPSDINGRVIDDSGLYGVSGESEGLTKAFDSPIKKLSKVDAHPDRKSLKVSKCEEHLTLTAFLKQKRVDLLDSQTDLCKEYLQNLAKNDKLGSPLSSRASLKSSLCAILDWICTAIRLEPKRVFLELFVESSRQLSKFHLASFWSISVRNGEILMVAIESLLSSCDFLLLLNSALVTIFNTFGFMPSSSHLGSILTAIGLRLSDPSPSTYVDETLYTLLITVLNCALQSNDSIPEKKRFAGFVSNYLNPLSKVYFGSTRCSQDATGIHLSPLSVKVSDFDEWEKRLRDRSYVDSSKTDLQEKHHDVSGLVHDIVDRALFNDAVIESYEPLVNYYETKEQTKKQPVAKNLSFVRKLVTELESCLGNVDLEPQISSLVPILLQLFGKRLGAYVATHHKGKESLSTTNKEAALIFRMFLLLCRLCEKSTTSYGLLAIAKMLRLVIDMDFYSVSRDFDALSKWFIDLLDSWAVAGHVSYSVEKYYVISLLLELDHRIIHGCLERLISFGLTSLSDPVAVNANCSIDPSAGVILRIADAYARLRSISTVVVPLISASRSRPELIKRFVFQESCLVRTLGKFLGDAPDGQLHDIWDTLMSILPQKSERATRIATASDILCYALFAAFLENVSVTDRNMHDLRKRCGDLVNSMSSRCKDNIQSSEHISLLAGPAVLIDASDALCSLCSSWKWTVAESEAQQALKYEGVSVDIVREIFSHSMQSKTTNSLTPIDDVNRVMLRACCRLSIRRLRSFSYDHKNITKLMLVIFSCKTVASDVILANLGVISKYASAVCIQELWVSIFRLSLDAEASIKSPLCNASFFELENMRKQLAKGYFLFIADIKRRKNFTEYLAKLWCLLAAFPLSYLKLTHSRKILKSIVESEESNCKEFISARHQILQHLITGNAVLVKQIVKCAQSSDFWGLDTDNDELNVCLSRRSFSKLAIAIGSALVENCSENSVEFFRKSDNEAAFRSVKRLILLGIIDRCSLVDDKSKKAYFSSRRLGLEKLLRYIEAESPYLSSAFLLATRLCLRWALSIPEVKVSSLRDTIIGELDSDGVKGLEDYSVLLHQVCRIMSAFYGGNPVLIEKVKVSLWRLQRMCEMKSFKGCPISERTLEMTDLATKRFFRSLPASELSPILEEIAENTEALALQQCTIVSGICNPKSKTELASVGIGAMKTLLPIIASSSLKKKGFEDAVGELLIPCLTRYAFSDFERFGFSTPLRADCLGLLKHVMYHHRTLWHKRKFRKIRLILEGMALCSVSNCFGPYGSVCVEDKCQFISSCVDVFYAMVKTGGKFMASRCAAAVVSVLHNLLRNIISNMAFDSKIIEEGMISRWSYCLEIVVRICEELALVSNVYKHHAVYWLRNYLNMAIGDAGFATVPQTHSMLKEASYYWLDMCGNHELQQLHAASDEQCRLFLAELRSQHLREHKFSGKT